MKRVGGLVGVATVFLLLLLAAQPFDLANDALDRVFDATPKWTQVTNLVINPATQEISHGEHPLQSLATLERTWAANTAPRVIFIGNSQMLAVSLAPGELPSTAPEKTWVDQLGSHGMQAYRLSAPGMSYSEALWYVHYLLSRPGLKPAVIVLQLNYQSFWNGNIRAGGLELLNEGIFRAGIESEAAAEAEYAEEFRAALDQWDEKQKSMAVTSDARNSVPPGTEIETIFRGWEQPLLEHAAEQKSSLFDMLYRLRVYVLRLTPTTARTIAGTRWLRSKASVAAIARLCRERNTRLVLYNAPVNPRVNLYRRAEDRQQYMAFLNSLETTSGVLVHDLESSIPEQLWGRWLNGPDPLHLGRTGHVKLAARMGEIIQSELAPAGN